MNASFRVSDGAYGASWGPEGNFASSWDGYYDARPRLSEDGERVFYQGDWGMNLLFRTAGKAIRQSPGLRSARPFGVNRDGTRIAWTNDGWDSRLYAEAVSDNGFAPLLDRPFETRWGSLLELSPDGNRIVAGDRLYSTATGERLSNYASPDGVYRCTFAPDGARWGFALAGSKSLVTCRTSDPIATLYNLMETTVHVRTRCYTTPTTGASAWRPLHGVQMYDMQTDLPVGGLPF